MGRVIAFVIVIGAAIYLSFSAQEKASVRYAAEVKGNPFLGHYYPFLRDTIYVKANGFVDVNLTTQTAEIHRRNQPVFEIKISSGNHRVLDGMKTTTGLFAIYSKDRTWHSRQFDSTLMLYWMPFSYGIGFHALAGRSYYRYLGVRPSSHGCVRISREDGYNMFESLDVGSPVLVHYGDRAICLAFTDDNDYYQEYPISKVPEEINKRLEELYSGNYFLANEEKIALPKHFYHHDGLPIGMAEKIPKKQKYRIHPVITIINPSDRTLDFERLSLKMYADSLLADSVRISDLALQSE